MDLELKELLVLGLVVDHGGEHALDGLIAVDLHGEVFGEEHLSVGGEGDGEAEEKQEGEASQGLKGVGRCA